MDWCRILGNGGQFIFSFFSLIFFPIRRIIENIPYQFMIALSFIFIFLSIFRLFLCFM